MDTVIDNLVYLKSKKPYFQSKYHSFILSVFGQLNPVGAVVGVFDYHPDNITCWAMENAIFDEDFLSRFPRSHEVVHEI